MRPWLMCPAWPAAAPEPPPSNTASMQGGEPGQSRQESGDDEDDEDDEDETCGFCIFMKAGGCRKSFTVRLDCGMSTCCYTELCTA